MNGPGLDVRQAGRERTRVRGTEDGAHRPLCRRPLEGPSMTPPWYLPASRADGMARLGTLTAEEVQVSMQARTEITDTPTTRPSER
jgi:hypothetical protein